MIFSFEGNISQEVLDKLSNKHKAVINSDESEINKFIKGLLFDHYSFIIGLGEYSGKDKDRLRIEVVCSNKFRNKVLGQEYKKINISEFLKPSSKSKLAKGIGNSYCNLISYLIMKNIKESNQQILYAFIHIPKGFSVEEAANEINQILKTILKD